jgi:hypothetical protein
MLENMEVGKTEKISLLHGASIVAEEDNGQHLKNV